MHILFRIPHLQLPTEQSTPRVLLFTFLWGGGEGGGDIENLSHFELCLSSHYMSTFHTTTHPLTPILFLLFYN